MHEDFFGLRAVWPPKESTTISKFDLVVVHGLAGGSLSTWTHGNGSCWLEWLSAEIPELRIFVFGYPAQSVYFKSNVEGTTDSSRVFTFAENLCLDLKDARRKQHNPVTFMGHGVGGIIIKNALTYCNSRKELYGEIVSSTHHIMFLETPHHGLSTDTWQLAFGQAATEKAKEQFNIWSSALLELGRTFTGIGNSLHITSVYSHSPDVVNGVKIEGVDEGSATLNSRIEYPVHLDNVSHLSMCKFKDRDDPSYNRLLSRIKAEIEEFDVARRDIDHFTTPVNVSRKGTQEMKEQTARDATRLEQERNAEAQLKLKKKIKKWLRPPDTKEIQYKADLASKSVALEGTCKWLLTNDDYTRWKASETSSLAWLHGIQGSGKSTLVAYAVNHLQTERQRIAYLFCRQDAAVSTAMLINCLTLQMIKLDSRLLNELQPIYEKTVGASLVSLQTATMVFNTAMRAFGPCFIVIDALDECLPDDRQSLMHVLLDCVTEVTTGLKILCSSKNEPDLDRIILAHDLAIGIAITSQDIEDDVEIMIRTNIGKKQFLSQRLGSAPPHYLSYVVEKLRAGAQGMFLLPKYMVEDLDSKGSIDEISAFLLDLPIGLHEYYLMLLERMDQRWRPMAKRVFTWVVWAKRPLSVPELKEILEIDGNQYPNLAVDAKAACSCLLSIEEDEIRVSHSSVKRFLLESQAFRDSQVYSEYIEISPNNILATACTRYLFEGRYSKPPRKKERFSGRNPTPFRDLCPFILYAAFYWIAHCRESSDPNLFIGAMKTFVLSEQLPYWGEVVGHLVTEQTNSFNHLCNLLQTFIIELKVRVDVDAHGQSFSNLEVISTKLSRVRTFLELWGDVILIWPEETETFWPLTDSPNYTFGIGRQGCLMTGSRFSQAPDQLHDMLEKRMVAFGFDRFLLADINIFLWQSLMPSEPWDRAFGDVIPLDITQPSRIYLRTESILTGRPSSRWGIDPAEVGSIQASTVVRKDLRAVAIVWARYSSDKTQPLVVKTYAWYLRESLNEPELDRLEWADLVDPCRIDLTVSNCFRKSKGATAFWNDETGEYIWTPGGKYELGRGINTPPPPLFHDAEISGLTFCSNATAIAGLRNENRIELYDIPRFRLVSFANGNCTILGLSPGGRFVLFIKRMVEEPNNHAAGSSTHLDDNKNPAKVIEEVCLLTREKCIQIWSSQHSDSSGIDLEYFYNNGGLHSFADNESILVLCVPTNPEWSLLAFDLESNDVAGTSWKVEYTSLLEGANILSFSLCPIHERRLYLVDSYGIMRTLGIARLAITTQAISTVRRDDSDPILSAILESPSGSKLVTATVSFSYYQTVTATSWSLHDLRRLPREDRPLSFLRHLMGIKSETLIVDFDPILASIWPMKPGQPNSWPAVAAGAQGAIDATTSGVAEVLKELDMSKEDPMRNLSLRLSTKATFNSHATLGFFQTLIYVPIPSVRGQPFWNLTMIMDIRSLETSKARKTGAWWFAEVGTTQEEHMACAYNETRRLLAYSVCVEFMDRSKDMHKWFTSRLYLSHLGPQEYYEIDQDPRGTFIQSFPYDLDYGRITAWLFSESGRYLYGMSTQGQSRVLVFDTVKGSIIKTIFNPLYHGSISAMTLTIHENELYVCGSGEGGAIIVARLPLNPSSKYEARIAALGPFGIETCQKLRLVFANSHSTSLVIIGQGTNYLRKDGKIGGTSQWPIVLYVKEEDMEPWTPWQLLEDPEANKVAEGIANLGEPLQLEEGPQIENDGPSLEDAGPDCVPNTNTDNMFAKGALQETGEGVVTIDENVPARNASDEPGTTSSVHPEAGAEASREDVVNAQHPKIETTVSNPSSEANIPAANTVIIEQFIDSQSISSQQQGVEKESAVHTGISSQSSEPGDEDIQYAVTATPGPCGLRPGLGFMHFQKIFGPKERP